MVQTSISAWLNRQRSSKGEPRELQSATATNGVEFSSVSGEVQDSTLPEGVVQTTTLSKQRDIGSPTSFEKNSITDTSKKLPPLPKSFTIERCSKEYINSFRRLVRLLLPIPYNDSFFEQTLSDPVIWSISRIALWHDNAGSKDVNKASLEAPMEATDASSSDSKPQLIAAIRCRMLASPPNDPSEETPILYVSTITTLSAFRRRALASHLLQDVVRTAVQEYGATAIMAHVWEANPEAMEWYKERGFRVVSKEETYYRRLAPQTAAWIVRREVGPSDLIP